MDELLFKKVFNNIVIFKNIFNHVRLYKKNQIVEFTKRKDLQEYKEREYINKIIYCSSEMLYVGDLPIGGVLKEVSFTIPSLSGIKGEAIPIGVEIICYSWYNYSTNTTQFSTLPSTVHTLKNAVLKLPNKGTNLEFSKIPPNIKSISFLDCPPISCNNTTGFFILPNTIRSLQFSQNWDNGNIPLSEGDIPEGVTFLSILGFKVNKQLSGMRRFLPNSIKELHMCDNSSDTIYDFIPNNLETLFLFTNYSIYQDSCLNLCKSIKKLKIILEYQNGSDIIAKGVVPNSLPPNLDELILIGITNKVKKKTIPSNVRILELKFDKKCKEFNYISKNAIPNTVVSLETNRLIYKPNTLPQSLKKLKYDDHENPHQNSEKNIIRFFSNLPNSITSATLPKSLRTYHSSINSDNKTLSTSNKIKFV